MPGLIVSLTVWWRRLLQSVQELGFYRFRWLFFACLLTLGITAGVVGTVVLTAWQKDRALTEDTRLVLDYAARELTDALHAQRTAVAALREQLPTGPTTVAQRTWLARRWLADRPAWRGLGMASGTRTVDWWVPPLPDGSIGLQRLTRHVTQRSWAQATARKSGQLLVFVSERQPVWVLSEPSRARQRTPERLLVVVDMRPWLETFFRRTLPRPQPLRLLAGAQEIYRSPSWRQQQDVETVTRTLKVGSARWTLAMHTGTVAMVPRAWLQGLLILVGALAAAAMAGLVWAMERISRLATTDALTGLANRRIFLEHWTAECDRAQRYQRPLTCLMIDVNGFKPVNDLLGHPMGDRALKAVARALHEHLRRSDLVARFGGDEFIIALPETDLTHAQRVVDKLRALTIDGPWAHHPRLGGISLSVGAAQLQPDEAPEAVLRRADAALYASRQTPSRLVQGPAVHHAP